MPSFKLFRSAVCAVLCLFGVGTASATLIDRGGGMIYDTDLNITWLADANLFKTQLNNNPDLINQIIDSLPTIYVGQTGYSGTIPVGPSNYGHGGSYLIDTEGAYHRFLTAGEFSTSTGKMSWWGAKAWVSQLNVSGYDDWRLPTLGACPSAPNCTESELGHLFYSELGGVAGSSIAATHNSDFDLFTNIQPTGYWSGTDTGTEPFAAWGFGTNALTLGTYDKYDLTFYSWAVRDGDVTAVPEPTSLDLLVIGLAGLGFARRKKAEVRYRLTEHPGRSINDLC